MHLKIYVLVKLLIKHYLYYDILRIMIINYDAIILRLNSMTLKVMLNIQNEVINNF